MGEEKEEDYTNLANIGDYFKTLNDRISELEDKNERLKQEKKSEKAKKQPRDTTGQFTCDHDKVQLIGMDGKYPREGQSSVLVTTLYCKKCDKLWGNKHE